MEGVLTSFNNTTELLDWLLNFPVGRQANIAAALLSRVALRVLPIAMPTEGAIPANQDLVLKLVFWQVLLMRNRSIEFGGDLTWSEISEVQLSDVATWQTSGAMQSQVRPEFSRIAIAHAYLAITSTYSSHNFLKAIESADVAVGSGLPWHSKNSIDKLVDQNETFFWDALREDASWISATGGIEDLEARPLFRNVPIWWLDHKFDLRIRVSKKFAVEDRWDVWLDWYDSVSLGLSGFRKLRHGPAKVLARNIALGSKDGSFNKELWQRKPGEINRKIAEWVAEARAAEVVVENQPTELTGEARLAGYRFVDDGETIKGQYHVGAAFEAEIARQLLHELLQKLKNTAERLTRAQVDPALPKVIQAIADYLDKQSASMNAGLVLSQFRTWETILASVSAALLGQPLDNDLPGILASTQQTFEDLKAMFPSIGTIEANRLALRLQSADAQTVDQSIVAISVLAETNIAVDQSARDALKDLQVEVSKLNEIIASSSDHDAVAVAIETRGVIVGQRAMTNAGFVHTVLKAAGNRIAKGAGDGLEKGVAEVTEAGVKLALIGLAGKLAGPLASVAALLAMFKPYAKKAEEIKKETEKDDDVTDV